MRILLTNDDGIEAPGLASLHRSLSEWAEVLVVAPRDQRSECGHSVTTRGSIHFQQRFPGWWAVDGTPVDCVRIACQCLEGPIDAVFSGVNEGGNLGTEIYLSGTVAAAREAAFHDIPAVAVSHYRHPQIARTWDHVPQWLRGRLQPLVTSQHKAGQFWNLNLPAIDPADPTPELVSASTDCTPLPFAFVNDGDRVRYTCDYQGRARHVGTDVAICFGGSISLAAIPLRWPAT